jgi:glutamine amidotransferase
MIAIVDYKVGNLGSIQNMFKKIGVHARITSDPEGLREARGLLLPGVGHFEFAKKALDSSGLVPYIEKKIFEDKIPLLGICVGYQLLTSRSEEGPAEGLGWLSAEVKKFRFSNESPLRVPHMGWNHLEVLRTNPLLELNFEMKKEGEEKDRFYFAHSYYVQPRDETQVLAQCEYGFPFAAAMRKDNIFGVQFHPEKSHRFGMGLFRKFSDWCEKRELT